MTRSRIQWEASFFGLLSGVGLVAVLTAMLLGGLVAAGVMSFSDDGATQVDHVTTAGGAIAAAIFALGYLTAGYVAARMARFDGWRQGLGVWLLSVLVSAAAAVAAWISSGDLDPTKSISLPSDPIDAGPLGHGWGLVFGAAALIALVAAILGGVLGDRYHRAVDRDTLEQPALPPEADTRAMTGPETESEQEAEPDTQVESEHEPASTVGP